jgi:hypothetical protein
LAASPCERGEGPRGRAPDAAALERRHDHAEACGGRRPRWSRCLVMSVATRSDRAHCGGCCPPGLPAIPPSPLSFPIGAVFCPPFASSSITWLRSFRKRSRSSPGGSLTRQPRSTPTCPCRSRVDGFLPNMPWRSRHAAAAVLPDHIDVGLPPVCDLAPVALLLAPVRANGLAASPQVRPRPPLLGVIRCLPNTERAAGSGGRRLITLNTRRH